VEQRIVPAASFGSRPEAELARGLLESVGIPAFVSADDAGGMRPPLQLSQGVRLMVREADLTRARRVLADHAGEA